MQQLNSISQINTDSIEGKYLMAALAKITTDSQTDKTPDEVIKQVGELQTYMYSKEQLPKIEAVIEVAEKIYKEVNPGTTMDVPAIVYESLEQAWEDWKNTGSFVIMPFYNYCRIRFVPKATQGLYPKYIVKKSNGNPVDEKAEYFVLRLDDNGKDKKHIEACRKAVLKYAYEIRDHLPELSKDLFAKYGAEIS